MFGYEGQTGKCAFHSRGDQRGLVQLTCSSGRGQVRLDGDRTRFVNDQGLDQATMDDILSFIGRMRLEALQRHRDDMD